MSELEVLLAEEIPAGRSALLESHNNLQKVSSYCAQKYIDEPNKKNALEETKNFTTQSLASVAYQINTLASNMLHMLDIQATQLANMDSSINNISQDVDIHKEKVARREIGLLTTNKVVTRTHQIVAPTNPDRPTKYVRKPIDFSELDDIGHGVKLSQQPSAGATRRPSAISNKKSPNSSVDGLSKRDSLKSNMSGYGTLRAVKAPTVPQDYGQANIPAPPGMMTSPDMTPYPPSMMSPQEVPPPPPMSISSPESSGGYSTPQIGYNGRAPSMGGSAENYAATSVMDLPLPPPVDFMGSNHAPFLGNVGRNPSFPVSSGYSSTITENDGIPIPPMGGEFLPPPPMMSQSPDEGFSIAPGWAPKSYLEKMVVIYDYAAENDDELNLREDQIVYVVKMNDDGWYEGVLDGRTGLFPGNYAEATSA